MKKVGLDDFFFNGDDDNKKPKPTVDYDYKKYKMKQFGPKVLEECK